MLLRYVGRSLRLQRRFLNGEQKYPVIDNLVDVNSAEFQENNQAMSKVVSEMKSKLDTITLGIFLRCGQLMKVSVFRWWGGGPIKAHQSEKTTPQRPYKQTSGHWLSFP